MKITPMFRLVVGCLFAVILLNTGCSKKLHTDRHQFIHHIEKMPAPELNGYKSVQRRINQDANTALAITVSGGGSRASNFGAGVLLGLEQLELAEERNVLREADYFSTVSGGGFPIGAYINSLYDHHHFGKGEPYSFETFFDETIKYDLRRSYLKPMIRGFFLYPRLWFSFFDEGDVLERSIDNHVLGYKHRKRNHQIKKSIVLGDLFVDKNDSKREVLFPMHVANGTNFESMEIFPFMPNVMEGYQISTYTHRVKKFKAVNNVDPSEIPYAVGIKASGSFPVAISNTTLESGFWEDKCFLHIIDGGLADNIGYKTAVELLNKEQVAKRKLMFVIDADNTGYVNTFSNRQAAVGSLRVLGKLSYSSLDSRHVVLEKEMKAVCGLYDIHPLIFSFETLVVDNEAIPPDVIRVKDETKRLIGLLKKDLRNISPNDLQVLYELCTNIATKYSITEIEQELLLLTGQKVVDMKRHEIMTLMTGKNYELRMTNYDTDSKAPQQPTAKRPKKQ